MQPNADCACRRRGRLAALLLSALPAISLAGAPQAPKLSVEQSSTTVYAYATAPRPVENRIDSMNVYALAKSAWRLRSGHMLSLPLYRQVQKAGSPRGFRQELMAAAASSGLEWELIAAVIMAESGFNPRAVSPKGAHGLMQLMPDTWLDLGVKDPLSPSENISAGSRYLKQQLNAFGTPELALAAYNAGPQAVRGCGGIPPYAETERFVARVLDFYRQYKQAARAAPE